MRRAATGAKTGFAGVPLAACFATSRPVMAAFNARIARLRPFCRWELSVMVEMQGSDEEAVRCGGVAKSRDPYKHGRNSPSRRGHQRSARPNVNEGSQPVPLRNPQLATICYSAS